VSSAEYARIEQVTPQRFEELMTKRPLVYVPCGLVEWHGKHLPLGLDGLKMHGLAVRCAEQTGGIVLPVSWFNAPGFGAFCGTMVYPAEMVRELLVKVLEQTAKMGAKVIALLTGHYGDLQVNTVKHAAAEFMKANPDVQVLARPEYENVLVDGEAPQDHAGKWETSIALHLFPELTRMDEHRPGEEAIVKYGEEHAQWPSEKQPWVWHQDLRATASAELGARAVEAIRDRIVADIEQLCARAGI
jgi:creatinine amidohydrolase